MLLKKAFIQVTREACRHRKANLELVEKELALEAMGRDEYVPSVEHIQDLVEKYIMAVGYFDVTKEYIIYRYEHEKIRAEKKEEDLEKLEENKLKVTKRDGRVEGFSENKIRKNISHYIAGYEKEIDVEDC